MLLLLLLLILAYLLGSICSAIIIAKLFNLPDPRQTGSKNPGTTNILRTSGKKYAIIVLLFDMLKGVIPVIIAKLLGLNAFTIGLVGLFAVLGHIYPIFFNFEGGKGVATALGVVLGLNFTLGLLVILTWLAVAYFSKYSSLAAITAFLLAPLYALIINKGFVFPLILISAILIYKHKDNIQRLQNKTEPKIKI